MRENCAAREDTLPLDHGRNSRLARLRGDLGVRSCRQVARQQGEEKGRGGTSENRLNAGNHQVDSFTDYSPTGSIGAFYRISARLAGRLRHTRAPFASGE